MIYFYARVSTSEQNLARQLEVAKKYKNVDEVFADKMSGKDFERVEYQRMKTLLREGDEVVVKSLDRLGRNKEALKQETEWFKAHGVTLRLLDIPTTLIDMPGQAWVGEMVTNILIEVMASFAEQERINIRERQREGIEAKRKSGHWDDYGRPKKVPDDAVKACMTRVKAGAATVAECCGELGIDLSTWYRRVKKLGA